MYESGYLRRNSMSTRQISVLMFSNSTARGGAEEHIAQLLQRVDRRLFSLHLACTPEMARLLEKDLPSDVKVARLTLDSPKDIDGAWELGRLLRKWKIDILHSHLFRASLFASPVGRLFRIPVIIETPHLRETWRKGWLKSNFLIDRLAGFFVDRYIAVSEANARYLVEQKRIPASKVTIIQNGCPLDRVNRSNAKPAGIRERLGFGSNEIVMLVMGRLEPQKGHRVLLQAMASFLRERVPELRLVCAGTGTLQNELEKMTKNLNLSDVVRFVGFQSNVADWLAMADIGVLPSFYEGLPLAAIESLAAGLPLIATAVDGTPEVVVNGETGLLVPPGDPKALADAIALLALNADLRSKLAWGGIRRVNERFTIQRQIGETEKLYLAEWKKRATPTLQAPYEEAVRASQH